MTEEEVAVRYIPTSYHPKYGWNGNKPALCFIDTEGKVARCVVNDELEIHAIELPLDIIARSRRVEYGGVSYPIKRFVERLLASKKPLSEESSQLLSRIELPTEKVLRPIAEGSSLGFTMEDEPKEPKFQANGRSIRTKKKTGGGSTLIARLAEEYELPQPKLRRFLRDNGMRAPYTDEAKIRKTMENYSKETTSGKTKLQKGSKGKKRSRA